MGKKKKAGIGAGVFIGAGALALYLSQTDKQAPQEPPQDEPTLPGDPDIPPPEDVPSPAPPEAVILNFDISPLSGFKPLLVTGFIQPGDPRSQIIWKWDDGTETLNQQNPTHEYFSKGTYNGRVTVKRPDGRSDFRTFTINVLEASQPPPEEDIPNTITSADAFPVSGDEPLSVNFSVTVSGSSLVDHIEYFFDDGTQDKDAGFNHLHVYTRGNFNPTVRVVFADGTTKTASFPTIKVNAVTPEIISLSDNQPLHEPPVNVSFSYVSNGFPVLATWDFNDGTSATRRFEDLQPIGELDKMTHITHTYEKSGTFTPTLFVKFDTGDSDTAVYDSIVVPAGELKLGDVTINLNAPTVPQSKSVLVNGTLKNNRSDREAIGDLLMQIVNTDTGIVHDIAVQRDLRIQPNDSIAYDELLTVVDTGKYRVEVFFFRVDGEALADSKTANINVWF